jgi:hypothetical protein
VGGGRLPGAGGWGDPAHQLLQQTQCPQVARSEQFLEPRQQLVLLHPVTTRTRPRGRASSRTSTTGNWSRNEGAVGAAVTGRCGKPAAASRSATAANRSGTQRRGGSPAPACSATRGPSSGCSSAAAARSCSDTASSGYSVGPPRRPAPPPRGTGTPRPGSSCRDGGVERCGVLGLQRGQRGCGHQVVAEGRCIAGRRCAAPRRGVRSLASRYRLPEPDGGSP